MLKNFYLLLSLLCSFAVIHAQKWDIVLNPTGFTPLSAVLKLPQTNTESLTIYTLGKEKEDNIAVFYPPNSAMEFAIHGLYQNYTNKIAIKFGNDKAIWQNIITKPLVMSNLQKTNLFNIKTKVLSNSLPADSAFDYDLYFTSMPNGRDVLGFDKKGDIRYSYQNPDEKPTMIKLTNDKNDIYMIYISEYKYYIKRNLIGQEIFRNNYPVHHDITDYTNGHELILGNSKWGWEDMVFELNDKKNIIKELSIGDLIRNSVSDKDQHLLDKLIFDSKNIYQHNDQSTRIDWAHGNSLVYDRNHDRLYLSLRHLGILAIKYTQWKLEWFIVDGSLKTSSGVEYGRKPKESIYLTDIPSLQKYRMKISPSMYNPRGQHALLLRKNGNLLLFDNRSQGEKNPQGSRILEYVLDHQNKKAGVAQWFVNSDRSYSRFVGDVDLSGEDRESLLLFYGNSNPRRIMEIDSKNKILFDMTINTAAMFYRVDKYPLYPYRNKSKKYTVDSLE